MLNLFDPEALLHPKTETKYYRNFIVWLVEFDEASFGAKVV